jgi:tetratricopeptide (TPR) repeat protein
MEVDGSNPSQATIMKYENFETRLIIAESIRESGDLNKSNKLLRTIIKDLKSLLHKNSSRELNDLYIRAVGHYVIQKRLEAKELFKEALNTSKNLQDFTQKENIKSSEALRSLAHVLIDMGEYEIAEKYLRQLVELNKEDINKLSDAKSHLARCLHRMGKLKEAERLIGEAVKGFENSNSMDEYFSVWYTRALMFKAYILDASGKRKEAIRVAEKSLKIAERENRVFRIDQAKRQVEYLKSK